MKADQSLKDNVFNTCVILILLCLALIVVVPFLFTFFSSFATSKELLLKGVVLWPKEWTLEAYRFLLDNDQFTRAFKNAVYLTVVGTTINMTLSILMAYGLSQPGVKGRTTINFMVLFTMLFHGGMIPTYLVVNKLGLINSYWSIWLVNAIAPFNMIVMRSFFQTLPNEMKESARIDGCGEFKILWRIILPISLPVLVTFTLFYTVANWNTYFQAVLYLNNANSYPLQVFLRQVLIVNTSELGLAVTENGYAYTPAVRHAAILLAAMPLILVYPFMQKYFSKGMMMGSVKG
ncbi:MULTISPECIES: carbohydrate ABC transporter permease [unclassified Paenibacillus]|uniref:carbohydrate ABC transporter permease n=1 Tax=unclassified Paenibacillus TaxID=185978 RepID=UPI0007094399|nr:MULTISPECIES: carbohydrate ABC transporter permease [unclassified Paenibacillus]KQX48781.1 ABC transporter permease [Paenibacillus sp. Root444D2]KRE36401.1 ABC transporter permease [Paenibacillus sp. Soil724D2]